jgi:hypothetical protein
MTAYSEAGKTQLLATYRNFSGGTKENHKIKIIPDLETKISCIQIINNPSTLKFVSCSR